MSQRTKSTQLVVGKQEYLNKETGEVKTFNVSYKEEQTDFNFQKIWIKDLINILQALGGGKVKVFCHLLNKKNSENIVIASISELAKKTKTSENTVKATLKIMKQLDYIRMIRNGVYQISPNLIVKGKSSRRQILLTDYYNIQVTSVA